MRPLSWSNGGGSASEAAVSSDDGQVGEVQAGVVVGAVADFQATEVVLADAFQRGSGVTLTVAMIIITGIFGNVIAVSVCRLFRITDPIAKGVSIGSAAHALGTAKALEIGEVEGAMSSLSIVVAGLLTVVGASIFANFM